MLAQASVYRAGVLKSALRELERQQGQGAEHIFEAYGEASVALVQRAASIDWVDIELLLELNRAIDSTLGRAGFSAFWKEYGRAATHHPIFRPLVDGIVRMFGSGRGLVKMLPRGSAMVSRHLGAMKVVELEADRAVLEYAGFPFPEHLELFSEANRSSIEGSLLLVAKSSEATLEQLIAGLGGYRIRVSWQS